MENKVEVINYCNFNIVNNIQNIINTSLQTQSITLLKNRLMVERQYEPLIMMIMHQFNHGTDIACIHNDYMFIKACIQNIKVETISILGKLLMFTNDYDKCLNERLDSLSHDEIITVFTQDNFIMQLLSGGKLDLVKRNIEKHNLDINQLHGISGYYFPKLFFHIEFDVIKNYYNDLSYQNKTQLSKIGTVPSHESTLWYLLVLNDPDVARHYDTNLTVVNILKNIYLPRDADFSKFNSMVNDIYNISVEPLVEKLLKAEMFMGIPIIFVRNNEFWCADTNTIGMYNYTLQTIFISYEHGGVDAIIHEITHAIIWYFSDKSCDPDNVHIHKILAQNYIEDIYEQQDFQGKYITALQYIKTHSLHDFVKEVFANQAIDPESCVCQVYYILSNINDSKYAGHQSAELIAYVMSVFILQITNNQCYFNEFLSNIQECDSGFNSNSVQMIYDLCDYSRYMVTNIANEFEYMMSDERLFETLDIL